MRPFPPTDRYLSFAALSLRRNGTRHAQQHLRRFAPRLVVDRLDRGETIEPGEQEVSVLFADLRGYASFAERRSPAVVFRAVSGYARLVTKVVGDYGGLVVDFCGDGVMAVFGALEALPNKERAALAAAREICACVSKAPPFEAASGPLPSVGVGVATGEAYVGEISTGERTFWSAVGSTTNLAARLERLARDLRCIIAVDSRTYRHGGELALGLRRETGVCIRGLQVPEDVYVLFPEQT